MAASSSSRLRRRSAASSGLRHTMSRSPGNSSLVTSARSRSSNSDGITVPALTSLRMVGARSVVIQRSPSTPCRSSRMRAAVSIPRSPTSTTCCKPNRSRIFATWLVTVSGSTVEPSKTSTATGQPSAVHSSPKTICNTRIAAKSLSTVPLKPSAGPIRSRRRRSVAPGAARSGSTPPSPSVNTDSRRRSSNLRARRSHTWRAAPRRRARRSRQRTWCSRRSAWNATSGARLVRLPAARPLHALVMARGH